MTHFAYQPKRYAKKHCLSPRYANLRWWPARARLRTAKAVRSPPRQRKRRCRPRQRRRRRPRQRCWSGTRRSSRGWRSCAEYFAIGLRSPDAGRQVLRRQVLPRPRLCLLRRGGMRTGEEAQLGGVLGQAVVLHFGIRVAAAAGEVGSSAASSAVRSSSASGWVLLLRSCWIGLSYGCEAFSCA